MESRSMPAVENASVDVAGDHMPVPASLPNPNAGVPSDPGIAEKRGAPVCSCAQSVMQVLPRQKVPLVVVAAASVSVTVLVAVRRSNRAAPASIRSTVSDTDSTFARSDEKKPTAVVGVELASVEDAADEEVKRDAMASISEPTKSNDSLEVVAVAEVDCPRSAEPMEQMVSLFLRRLANT